MGEKGRDTLIQDDGILFPIAGEGRCISASPMPAMWRHERIFPVMFRRLLHKILYGFSYIPVVMTEVREGQTPDYREVTGKGGGYSGFCSGSVNGEKGVTDGGTCRVVGEGEKGEAGLREIEDIGFFICTELCTMCPCRARRSALCWLTIASN